MKNLKTRRRAGFLFDDGMSLSASLVFFFSFAVYLLSKSTPSGVNGYFYLKQIAYFFSTQSLYFQDRSLAFWLPFALRSILGSDLMAYHLSVAIVLGLFCFLQIQITKRLLSAAGKTPSPYLPWIVASIIFTQPQILFFAMNFYKNLFALTCILSGTLFFLKYQESRRASAIGCCIFFFILAILSHKSSLVLVGFGLLAVMISFRKTPFFKKALVLGPIVLGLMLGLFLMFFPKATEYLHFLRESFTFSTGYILWLKSQARLGNYIFGGYIVLGISLIFICWSLLKSRFLKVDWYFYWLLIVLLVALLPIHSIGQNQLGYRWLLSSLALAVPLPFLLWSGFRTLGGLLLGLHLCQMMYAVPLHRYFLDFESVRPGFEKITEFVKPEDYLIAHHGLEFYIDYKLNIRARIFVPEAGENRRVYRIVHVPFGSVRWQPLRLAVHQKRLAQLGREYFLMTEADWLAARQGIVYPPNSWQNPMEKNPGHVYQ